MPKVIAHPRQQACFPDQPAGFDFTSRMRLLCADMIVRTPELGHLDLSRIALTFSQDTHGLRRVS